MCRPYSVLLPVGFAVPLPLPDARCALAAPFRPYRAEAQAVCFLWHFPWGRPRRALPGTVPRWSPDFPPAYQKICRRPPGPLAGRDVGREKFMRNAPKRKSPAAVIGSDYEHIESTRWDNVVG